MPDAWPSQSKLRPPEIAAARRHVFLCIGPDCCAEDGGLARWQQLKRAIQTRRLPVLRSKAACLRVCAGGPWLVVYPEGVWYGAVTPERLERILREHVEGGSVIREWAVAGTGCRSGDVGPTD